MSPGGGPALMALLSCLRCLTRFAVGLEHCPHCLSEDFEEADVPKITTSAGPSHPEDHSPDGPPPPPAAPVEPEAAAPPAEVVPEPAPAPPPVSALKREHVEYAVEALGVLPEEAESMTKPDLVELARTAEPEADVAKPAPSLSPPGRPLSGAPMALNYVTVTLDLYDGGGERGRRPARRHLRRRRC